MWARTIIFLILFSFFESALFLSLMVIMLGIKYEIKNWFVQSLIIFSTFILGIILPIILMKSAF